MNIPTRRLKSDLLKIVYNPKNQYIFHVINVLLSFTHFFSSMFKILRTISFFLSVNLMLVDKQTNQKKKLFNISCFKKQKIMNKNK